MRPSNDQPVDAIDLALRDDAARWDPGPYRDLAQAFREAPEERRRRGAAAMWMAAALIVGLGSWWALTVEDAVDVDVGGLGFDVRAHVERVIQPASEVVFAPLETELLAVTEDAEAIASVVWRGMRQPVARWLSESE